MIILFAAALFSAMIFLAVRKHQQERAKALVLAKAQRQQQLLRQQRPY